jgi:2-methylisocitrate lyase-like PEP mutase family enzyme
VTPTTAEKRAAFRARHAEGCFILPNPWDAGSARLLQSLGFQALASTSAGYAWSQGQPDHKVTLEGVLTHLTALSAATDLPVNADFESGFAHAPEDVAAHVTQAIATGVAGLSIEDIDTARGKALYDQAFAVERIKAARAAIDASGQDVILVARTEGLLADPTALTPTIDKLIAFADAGADCLFAPGVREKNDISAIVRAVAPRPVNVLINGPGLNLAELADLGVRRISIGGALARVAWGAVAAAAEQIKAGSFDGLASGIPGGRLNGIFGK